MSDIEDRYEWPDAYVPRAELDSAQARIAELERREAEKDAALKEIERWVVYDETTDVHGALKRILSVASAALSPTAGRDCVPRAELEAASNAAKAWTKQAQDAIAELDAAQAKITAMREARSDYYGDLRELAAKIDDESTPPEMRESARKVLAAFRL